MAKYGIKIKAIEEEEYCLIPMGGVLPRLPQRTLGIGGTAGMVHPSTGAPLHSEEWHFAGIELSCKCISHLCSGGWSDCVIFTSSALCGGSAWPCTLHKAFNCLL